MEQTLAYIRSGKEDADKTLVFLHGSTMTKEGMYPLAKEFFMYNCVVFDLTAHGQSQGEEPADIAQFAQNVEDSIQQLQKRKIIQGRIILLGYSMGGAITCEIAIHRNIELEGIVILSSGGNLKDYTPLVDDLKQLPVEEFKSVDVFPALFGKDTKEHEKNQIIKLFTDTSVADTIGYGDLMVSNAYDELDRCQEIQVPALFVHGSDDRIVLPMAAIQTWKRVDNSELLVIPFKGHAAIYEDTKTVKEKILAFIQTCG